MTPATPTKPYGVVTAVPSSFTSSPAGMVVSVIVAFTGWTWGSPSSTGPPSR